MADVKLPLKSIADAWETSLATRLFYEPGVGQQE